jgi:hypothetical protein
MCLLCVFAAWRLCEKAFTINVIFIYSSYQQSLRLRALGQKRERLEIFIYAKTPSREDAKRRQLR